MASNLFNISTYSRFNLSESESDIQVFVKEYGYRIKKQLIREDEKGFSGFISFAEKNLSLTELTWLRDNEERFFKDTPNKNLLRLDYLSETGFITSMIYSPDGEFLIVGHSSGLIQVNEDFIILNLHSALHRSRVKKTIAPKSSIFNMEIYNEIIADYTKIINSYYENEVSPKIWYPMFYQGPKEEQNRFAWMKENSDRFLKGTRNEILYNRWYCSELGAITALTYSPNGGHIIVGHASGMVQMRHGTTGVVLSTLRNIQFPPRPIYAIEYSRLEERVCYAACSDGAIYRIEIPNISASVEDPPGYSIRADPALECLNTQFYGSPGISSASTPLITQRSPALSLGISADQAKIIVGYADASIKMYDMETLEADLTYKVHKLRLQFIPKKLQRMHFGQVCALRCHDQKPFIFASGAWDNTLRIWDIRCKVGCIMTFEGVNICGDSIDFNRDYCIAGSWQPTEALSVWDLTAKKRLSTIRVQNRRPDVDGEYIYSCRYWRSSKYNRKGKYGIIGGSGTNCVEVINLHNRYITCSYPCPGTVLAITSHEERIAFGGTAPLLNIVSFHDPKHEKYKVKEEQQFEFTMKDVTWFDEDQSDEEVVEHPLKITHSVNCPVISKISTKSAT